MVEVWVFVVENLLLYWDSRVLGGAVQPPARGSVEYAGVGVRCQLSGYRLSGSGLGLWLFQAAKVAYYRAIFSLFSSS